MIVLFNSCYNDNEYDLYPYAATPCDSTNTTYSKTMTSIMTANCNVCHSTAIASGGVITDTWDGLSVVALNGKLWGGVSWASGYKNMPNGGTQLSSCDLAKIKNWINQGAPNN